MKTSFDATDILFGVLDVHELKSAISGGLFHQDSRPVNSKLEDVVINIITIGDTNVQGAVLNVNIYVPDKKIKGTDEYYQAPGRQRLNAITSVVVGILKGNKGRYWKDGQLRITNISGLIPEPEIKQHYINIRVSMKLHANYS